MKAFLKFFIYGILFSGILISLTFLLDFAPLAGKGGNCLSNALVTGLILLGWGISLLRGNQADRPDGRDLLYGIKLGDQSKSAARIERETRFRIPSALGLFLAAAINLAVSYFY